MSIKERRKALGWAREELAGRAGVDKRSLQLMEQDTWSDEDAWRRVREVLDRTEAGEVDVRLPPPEAPPQGSAFPTAGEA